MLNITLQNSAALATLLIGLFAVSGCETPSKKLTPPSHKTSPAPTLTKKNSVHFVYSADENLLGEADLLLTAKFAAKKTRVITASKKGPYFTFDLGAIGQEALSLALSVGKLGLSSELKAQLDGPNRDDYLLGLRQVSIETIRKSLLVRLDHGLTSQPYLDKVQLIHRRTWQHKNDAKRRFQAEIKQTTSGNYKQFYLEPRAFIYPGRIDFDDWRVYEEFHLLTTGSQDSDSRFCAHRVYPGGAPAKVTLTLSECRDLKKL